MTDEGIRAKESSCPECSSEDVDYWDHTWADESYAYIGKCRACGCEFREWYELVYSEHTVIQSGTQKAAGEAATP